MNRGRAIIKFIAGQLVFAVLCFSILSSFAADFYVSSTATGGGDGSVGDPWNLSEAINDINNGLNWTDGDALYIKNDGTYYVSSDIAITNNGADAGTYSRWIGYTSTITDGGRPTFVANSGTNTIFDFHLCSAWEIRNFELDGNSTASYGIYSNSQVYNLSVHDATDGIRGTSNAGVFISCESYDNSDEGFTNAYFAINCLAYDNGGKAFENGNLIRCIARNSGDDNYYIGTSRFAFDIISDGGSQHGISLQGNAAGIANAIITDVPTGYYGIELVYGDADLLEAINFYNITDGSGSYFVDTGAYNTTAYMGTYFELDPEWTDPDNNDYSRTGTNLDNIGFGLIGVPGSAINATLDLGPVQSEGGGGGEYSFGSVN